MSTRIEEVKKQLSSPSEQERLAALSETLNYGQQGLELLIEQSIKDPSDRVKQFAYRVFRGDNSWLMENTRENLITCPTDIITCLAISPDNTILVGGSWKKIWVWNLQTGQIIRSIEDSSEGHSHWVLSVAISPNGNKLVSGGADKNIKVWNLKSGKLIHTLIDLSWYSNWITAVAITPDGKTIVSGSTTKTIKTWDLNTGILNKTLQHPTELSSVLSLCISHDGKVIACGSTNNKITLWNLDSGELIRSIEGHSAWIQSLNITSDNTTLISGSRDGVVKFWQSKPGEVSSNQSGSVLGKGLVDVAATIAGFSLGGPIAVGGWLLGRIIVAAGDNKDVPVLPLQTLQNLECTKTYPNNQSINSLACHVNQNILVVGFSKNIKVFDLQNNRIIYTEPEQPGFISSVAINYEGKTLAVAGKDWVTLLDTKTGKPLHAIKGYSYPKLSKIVISEIPQTLLCGQTQHFTVKGLDQNNREMSLNTTDVKWETTGGKIEQGLFTAGHRQGRFELKAKISFFEASITITIIDIPRRITYLSITPPRLTLDCGKTQQFTAQVLDRQINIMQETVLWEVNGGGTIDQNGNFIAGDKPGNFEIRASVSSIHKVVFITIIEPQKLTKLIITSSIYRLEFGQSFQFRVKEVNQYGDNIQTGSITWLVSSECGTIDQNGNFIAGSKQGDFEIIASVSSIRQVIPITIIEPPRLAELIIISSIPELELGQSFHFQVKGLDQYDNNIQTGTITWSASTDGGSIDQNGNFIAGSKQGNFEVIASVSSIRQVIPITIIEPPRLAQLIIISSIPQLEFGQSFLFRVKGVDQYGKNIQTGTITWSASTDGGRIDQNGNFIAGSKQGNFEVIASVSSIRRVIPITIIAPPRLAELIITSSLPQLECDQSFQFQVKGLDQYGNNINIGEVIWSTTGGSILNNGMFRASYQEEKITVTATVEEISVSAEVTIVEPPKVTTLVISPNQVEIKPGQHQQFKLHGLDEWDRQIAVGRIVWKATGGTIDQDGNFIADINAKGKFRVTATATEYNISTFADITVVSVLIYFSIFPKEVALKPEENFTFDVIGFNQQDEPIQVNQVYWQCTKGGIIKGNGTFIGGYEKREVTVNATVEGITQSVTVTLLPVLRRLEIYPQKVVKLKPGECQKFTAVGLDQYGNRIDTGKISWETTGGKIDQNGNFTAGHNAKGTFKVRATLTEISESGVRAKLLILGIYMRLLYHVFSLVDFTQSNFLLKSAVELLQSNFTRGQQTEQAENIETEFTNEETDILGFDIEAWLQKNIFKIVARILDWAGQLFINAAKISANVEVIVVPANVEVIVVPANVEVIVVPANKVDRDDEQDDDCEEAAKISAYNDFKKGTYKFQSNSKALEEELDYDVFEYKIENWFYRSQLFYDGYSINDLCDYNYTDYLTYMDSRNFFEYLMEE